MLLILNQSIKYKAHQLQTRKMTLRLASGSYDGTVRFWDPGTGTSIQSQTINLSNQMPNKIQISESKSKLVVGMNSAVKIFDLNRPTQGPERHFDSSQFKGNVTSVGFRTHDKIMYTSCQDGCIKIFDLRDKKKAKQIKQNKAINCAVFHPNDKQIMSGDQAGNFKVFDLTTEKYHLELEPQNYYGIRSISISQNGQNIIFADSKGFVYTSLANMHFQKPIQIHDDYILKCQISPNGKFLATCSADKKIKLHKIISDSNKIVLDEFKTLKGHFRWVWDCQFSCDSAYLISCSTDATIKLWNVEKAQLVQTLKGHQKGVVCLALNDIAEVTV